MGKDGIKFEEKVYLFFESLLDAYRDAEDRGLKGLKLELTLNTFGEDMTAMVYAIFLFYKSAVEGKKNIDIFDFFCDLNRLIVQDIIANEKVL